MREPDLKARWSAWKVPLPNNEVHSALAQWLLYCPGANLGWSYYVMILLHLRDVPGLKTAILQYPDAEHEIVVLALHPDSRPNPDVIGSMLNRMEPADQAHQFHGVGDRRAIDMCERLARRVVSGGLSPDSDYRSMWRTLIRNSIQHSAGQQ